jgi:hypothetical protein
MANIFEIFDRDHINDCRTCAFRDSQHDCKSDLLIIVCLNSKFPPPVELCWQNKNISKLGIVMTKVGNTIIL